MSSRRITIRVDDELRRELEQAARESGRSESELVRAALEQHMRSRRPRRSCYDLAVKAGLIGAATGLPPDLSTNPRHFEGFGGQ